VAVFVLTDEKYVSYPNERRKIMAEVKMKVRRSDDGVEVAFDWSIILEIIKLIIELLKDRKDDDTGPTVNT